MAQQNYTEEVDLSYLMKKFNNFFKKCIKALFMVLNFFIKYWIVTLLLLLIGFGYGYYKDSTASSMFENTGIVIPNFESVDYLYNTIEDLNRRISSQDTIYLKEALGINYKALGNVEIEPIPDIYNMMTKSREQIDVFRILYQNQELDQFAENIATSKYFKFHKITFSVKGENRSKEIIDNILTHWNNNPHFKNYGKIYAQNAEFQVAEYTKMIAQVDSVIQAISRSSMASNTGVAISDNTNLHLLLEQKEEMLNGLLQAEIRLHDYTEPVKMVHMDYDVKVGGISNKIKYPILFIALFGLIFFVRFLFVRMKRIAES